MHFFCVLVGNGNAVRVGGEVLVSVVVFTSKFLATLYNLKHMIFLLQSVKQSPFITEN
jgi:hypothetical protein